LSVVVAGPTEGSTRGDRGAASSTPTASPPSRSKVSARASSSGVRGAGLGGHVGYPGVHGRLVFDSAGVDCAAGVGLGCGVDERAPAEPVVSTRGYQCVEHADETVASDGRFSPRPRTACGARRWPGRHARCPAEALVATCRCARGACTLASSRVDAGLPPAPPGSGGCGVLGSSPAWHPPPSR